MEKGSKREKEEDPSIHLEVDMKPIINYPIGSQLTQGTTMRDEIPDSRGGSASRGVYLRVFVF